MNQRTLNKLEYTKILKMASEYAVSDTAKQKIQGTHPYSSEKTVRQALDQLDEVCQFLTNTAKNPVDYFKDVKPFIDKTKIGGTLRPLELLDILQVCRAAINAKNSLLDCKIIDSLPFLHDTAVNIYKCGVVADAIKNSILPEGEVADGASSQLREIRRELRRQNQNVRDALDRIIRSSNIREYLQEAVVTERNGRYVIPVKSEFRSKIRGIIHDQSSTGSTVFIEPAEVVEAENEIRRLEIREEQEIERILSELSALISGAALDISDNQDTLTMLDTLFAKAGFCNAFDCVKPDICGDLCIDIRMGRHPLIPKDRCVPINVSIGCDFRTLVITGPNTGGKTVSLKTVGLFILMCQTGFFLPASRVVMGIFGDVLCDIGDEQAIEQNLSTFSSHMTNIIYILNNIKSRTMILFDELCTGTDPAEGSALARAILYELLKKKDVLTFATTHYSELKTFAFETDEMENASMEFDTDTLMPTYRLIVGIPGKSNALEISKKLGLPESVADYAQNAMNKDELNVNRLLADIEHNKLTALKEKQDAETLRTQAEALKQRYEEKLELIDQKKKIETEKAKETASRIIVEAQEEARQIIKELRFNTDGLRGKDKNEQIEAARKRLSDKKKEYESSSDAPKKSGITMADIKPGMSVFVNHLGKTATVLELTGQNEVLLQVGILKMKTGIDDIEILKEEEKIKLPQEHKKIDIKAESVSSTVDLRGLNAEDAYIETDRFIDAAMLAGLNEVTLLHGKGTGALRTALHEYLKKHPRCKKFRIGQYGEGDAGVTIVTLK